MENYGKVILTLLPLKDKIITVFGIATCLQLFVL
jgi:hypothetical protein